MSRVRESQSLCPQINILSWHWKWKQVTLVLPQFTSQLCHLPALQNWARCLTSFCFSFITSKIGIMRGPTLKGDMRVNHAQLIMSAHNKHFVCVFKFYKIQLLDRNGSSITRVILAHHRSLSSVLLLTKWFWMYPYFCRYIHFSVVLCTFCLLFQMLSFTGIRYYFTSDFSISPWFVCIRWSNSVVDWSMID